tara:strand:- start:1334 stop:1858 length:525 start_codon:yes stop_codon:yes gene_type:complete
MNKMDSGTKRSRGFSMVELLVVISVILLLMAIIVGVYLSAKGRRDQKKVQAELKAITLAIHNYKTDFNFLPHDGFDPQNPDMFDEKMNGLYSSLTQDFEKSDDGAQMKNFLEGTQLGHDGNGSLVAPVDDPDSPDQYNYWRYNVHAPKNNPGGYDLWVPVMVGKETLIMGNWGN